MSIKLIHNFKILFWIFCANMIYYDLFWIVFSPGIDFHISLPFFHNILIEQVKVSLHDSPHGPHTALAAGFLMQACV